MDPLRSTIGDVVSRAARRTPQAHALTFEGRRYTFRDLDVASTRVAHALKKAGIAKGERVAAFGRNSDAYALLWLGAVKAGMIHVPVNYMLRGAELAYILRQSGARAVFSDAALAEAVTTCGHAVDISGTIRGGGDATRDILSLSSVDGPTSDLPSLDETDVAQLLYTSGTTGEPKGAVMSHRAFTHHYASCALALDMRAGERQLHALPLYHAAQMHVFLMPAFLTGGESWLLEAPDPERVLDAMAEHRIETFFAAPTVWVALLAALEKDTSRAKTLRKASYGASVMPLPVLTRLRELLPGLGFYNAFGQSEIGPLACVLRPEEHDARPTSAGRAIPFVDMRVVDDDMKDVAPGSVGEVVYRSPQLCSGYWNKPEETEAAFEGGWFHSGDLANIDAEGYITIVDRKKDIIKTGGVMVASREVEDAVFTHPSVQEVAVVSMPDPKWIEAVTAVVVRKPGASVEAEELLEHTRGRLAAFKVPKRFVFVDALPKNASGKILKRVLKEQL